MPLPRQRQTMLAFSRPSLGEDEIAEIVHSIKSGWITTGPKCHQFEKDICDYVGAKHAVALTSATAGLHLALLAAGIGPGDEVITTSLTFASTANMIVLVGAKPVFVDIGDDLNIDPALIEAAITPRTKAIIPVHFAGYPCDMDRIMAIAGKHRLVVIEDAAHAIGTDYRGRRIGSIGDMTIFSFHPIKNITCGGAAQAVSMTATEHLPIQNVTLEHVAIQTKAGMRFEWVDGITLRDVTIEPASGNPPIIFEHCTDIIQSE